MPKDKEPSERGLPPVPNAVETRMGVEVLEAALDDALKHKFKLVVVPTEALAFLLQR